MKALNLVAKRVVFGLAAVWGVLTAVFVLFRVTEDWVALRLYAEFAGFGGDPRLQQYVAEGNYEEALAAYEADRGLDQSLHEQYVSWIGDMFTLQWGYSFDTGEPVLPLVMRATATTATYVIPAVVIAIVAGLAVGLYAAQNPNSRLANSGRIGSYVLFGLPSFWLGGMYIGAVRAGVTSYSTLLAEYIFPTLLVAMTLLGGYLSYSRAHALEHIRSEHVMLVRAKGAGPLLTTRHVLRNAAIPFFSMLFTEVLGLLVLAIFVVEMLFGIQGLGYVFFFAVDGRDFSVILGCTMAIVIFGTLASIVQDVSYYYLDPRIDDV